MLTTKLAILSILFSSLVGCGGGSIETQTFTLGNVTVSTSTIRGAMGTQVCTTSINSALGTTTTVCE